MMPAVKSIKDVALRAERIYRIQTSPLRIMPDFIIIGAQKGGTTSLYSYLIEHPNILSARVKEVHFFDNQYHMGIEWYRAHFPTTLQRTITERMHGAPVVTGEGSPEYLYYPHPAGRVAHHLPHVKLIVVLRNPVDRTYSGYRHQVRWGHETLSFEDALAAEVERTRGEREKLATMDGYRSYNYQHFGYVARGMYAEQLENWLQYFPHEQLLVLTAEELYADPARVLMKTIEFLQLRLPDARRLQKDYETHNKSPEVPSKMTPQVRERLVELFKPHNARLYELLGMRFDWDH